MDSSIKYLLNGAIEYAATGNAVTVKTPNLTLNAREFDSYVSWVVTYNKMKLSIISEIGNIDYVFCTIVNFIRDMDEKND